MNRCAHCYGDLPDFAVFCPHCARAYEPDFARMAPSALLATGDLSFIVRSYWLELRFDAEPNANATALRLFGARAERMR